MRVLGLAALLVLSAVLPAQAQEAVLREPALEIEFATAPGGCFEMGDTFGEGQEDERPVHEVCLDGFYIARKEVTVQRFQQFVAETGYVTEAEKSNYCYVRTGPNTMGKGIGVSWSKPGFTQNLFHPVVCVTAADAEAYAAWLSRKTGHSFRLPTEAQWEFAARGGGRQMEYATVTGDMGRDQANFLGVEGQDRWEHTAPVGSLPANPLGIHDMSGNVYEWVRDVYDAQGYAKHAHRNPTVEGPGDRVKRGGSFGVAKDLCRAANRGSSPFATNDTGFRLVMQP